MSGRTWIMMLIVLAINWGGFVALLLYGLSRETHRRKDKEGERNLGGN